LEEPHPDSGTLWGSLLSEEADQANEVKRDTPVMCIIGNPPYSGESANKGDWIMKLMEDYKKEPGGFRKLQEKNPKWINDDYVKFLRYGQHYIEKNGQGVLAFINPHGYLDNPTFRGMRWNLLKTYDKIYTIDLHGNSKKKETAPDGGADVNVFDIMQGVSINLFVKTGKKKQSELGKVFHYDLFGKRELKYDFLNENSLKTIAYNELPNIEPNYFFAKKDYEEQTSYDKGFSVNGIFTLNNVGIVTARDGFTIHDSKQDVEKTITEFLKLDDEDARLKFNLGKDVRDWQVNFAKKDLQNNYPHKGVYTKISYRPFDNKWTFYTGKSKGFHCYPRAEVMQHFTTGKNVGLILEKIMMNKDKPYSDCFISNSIYDAHLIGSASYSFPLYIYHSINSQQTIDQSSERTPNLNSNIVNELSAKVGLTFTNEKETIKDTFAPIDILDYIYAVLHSPTYREKYKEFLKVDFPRVPYPKDKVTFWNLVKLGGEIRQLHLMESSVLDKPISKYPHAGSNIVGKPKYENGKVMINEIQYFEGVPEVAWNFYIGGYQPAQKWLKDRKDRELQIDDITHYMKIVVALSETDRLMKEIDKITIL
jgi:predicted helicase